MSELISTESSQALPISSYLEQQVSSRDALNSNKKEHFLNNIDEFSSNQNRSVSLHRNLSSVENKSKQKNVHYSKVGLFKSLQEDENLNKSTTNLKNTTRSFSETNFRINKKFDDDMELNETILREKREIVAKLEQQNKEIIKEIHKLKLKQLSNKPLDSNDSLHNYLKVTNEIQPNYVTNDSKNYQLSKLVPSQAIVDEVAELKTLKQRKDQLESRMSILESSRDELIDRLTQLDTYMKPCQESKIINRLFFKRSLP